MTTFSDLIEEARQHLMTGKPDIINKLSADISAGATSLQLALPLQGVNVGTRLVIGLEEFHVTEQPTGSTPPITVSVIPGMGGSSQASHTNGDIVYVNPQFSSFRIARMINRCLEGLSGHGLFYIKPLEFTFIGSTYGYNLAAADLIDIWRIRYDVPGSANDWPMFRPQEWHLDLHPDPTEFPGGKALFLHKPAFPGQKVRISYKASFTALTGLADNVETISGLAVTSHDIPPLGAAIRALAGREVKRTFLTQQPEPRRQEEVPPGSALRSVLNLADQYYQAIDREVSLLHRRYPMQL